MSEPLIPLPVWPFPVSPEREMLIRAAKASLGLPYRIQHVKAEPGSPGRVLAFGELPPHLCEAALIRPDNVDNLESVTAALRAALTAPEGAGGFFDEAAYVAALLPGSREVTDPLELMQLDDMLEERAMRRAMAA